MMARLQPPNAKDEFHLINVEEFMKAIDEYDLAQRNSCHIEDAFHEHWLSLSSDGIYLFAAPVFYLSDGIARFINGRHRTLVLKKHLAEIPMALANMDGFPVQPSRPRQRSIEALAKFSIRKVVADEDFVFPDLPVRYLGYDANIGK